MALSHREVLRGPGRSQFACRYCTCHRALLLISLVTMQFTREVAWLKELPLAAK